MRGSDAEFDRVISAFASYNRRPKLTEAEERARAEAEHKRDPKHIKALAKRRKAKRGGPR